MSDVDLEAEVARLRRWKAEASPLFDGMQDLGRALGVPLGALITGPEAVKAAEALVGRVRVAEAKVRRVEALADELDNLSRALHRGEQGPVQAGEASGLGMAAHRLRAALSDEARP